eukprot:2696991-Karenia_brevis.AAC.1
MACPTPGGRMQLDRHLLQQYGDRFSRKGNEVRTLAPSLLLVGIIWSFVVANPGYVALIHYRSILIKAS